MDAITTQYAASCAPDVREASPLEVFNIPLFEVPPMLDVRSATEHQKSHILCAVSVPSEDGLDAKQLLQRILAHNEEYGWCLHTALVIVYDDATSERAKWLVELLTQTVVARADVDVCGDSGSSCGEHLLRRLSQACKKILLLSHQRFAEAFGFCCMGGVAWEAPTFFDRLGGPLPRCALLQPLVFLAGRQVNMTKEMLELLGITHIVVHADSLDVMDGTSRGDSQRPFQERHPDVPGICYLKCDIPDRADDPHLVHVLEGTGRFLQQCEEDGGVAAVWVHGQSRSAAVVCAFLMVSRNVSVNGAWEIFREAQVETDARFVWWDALERLQHRLRKRSIEDVA
jgi:hypothetical protein